MKINCRFELWAQKLTLRMVSATMLKPLPATVMLRNFRGKVPIISLRKSEATGGIWLTSGECTTVEGAIVGAIRGATGASITSDRKLSNPCTKFGMLKSYTFGYVESFNDLSDAVVPNEPVFIVEFGHTISI